VNDPLRDLLWHTTPGLGAALIARLGAPEPDRAELGVRPRVRTPIPPALAEHRLAHGITHGVIGWYGAGGAQRPNTPADPDRLLRLLERDDPLVNATLFRLGRWPALRRAIVSRRRFHPTAPTPGPDDDGLLDLAPDLYRELLTTTNAAHLDAALWAHDPDLAAWASIAHAPRHRVGVLKARITLLAAGHAHHVRVTRRQTDALLPELPHAESQEAKGAAPLRLLPAVVDEAVGPTRFVRSLRAARSRRSAHAVVTATLYPDWTAVARAHDEQPLPRPAMAALAEHPRCPAALLVAFAREDPAVVEAIPLPPAEILAACVTEGVDQRTKVVLGRRFDAGVAGAYERDTVRPARLLLTALDHGTVEAAPAQAAILGDVADMLRAGLDRHGNSLWQGLYAVLPTCDTTVEGLIAAAAHARDRPPARPGRQAAWAYTVLIDIAGPAALPHATRFADDVHLAPLAGTGTLPDFLAEHLADVGGPITRRVLAGNALTSRAVLTRLMPTADAETAAELFRNPLVGMDVRHAALHRFTPTADVLATPADVAAVLAHTDVRLLTELAGADPSPSGRTLRLRAALRVAELAGTRALDALRHDPETIEAHLTGDLGVLRAAVASLTEKHTLALVEARSWMLHAPGVAAALADPVLDWDRLAERLRSRHLDAVIRERLAARPDIPETFARTLGERPYNTYAPIVSDRYAFANRPAGQRCSSWSNPVALLRAGALTVERFVADARATHVLTAAPQHPRLARVVARTLTRHLGDTLDAWLVATHLARTNGDMTLDELAATAHAAGQS